MFNYGEKFPFITPSLWLSHHRYKSKAKSSLNPRIPEFWMGRDKIFGDIIDTCSSPSWKTSISTPVGLRGFDVQAVNPQISSLTFYPFQDWIMYI